jgi:uncharacterized glyoxalase superfamily protein PhnB
MHDNPSPRVDGFAAVLGVRDVGAAVAHYRDVLGFQVEFTWADPPSYAGLRLGAACLHLAQSTRGTASRVCFFCTGLDALFRQLAANGAKITQPITVEPYNMREFWVADLDGNELIFGEPTHSHQTHS